VEGLPAVRLGGLEEACIFLRVLVQVRDADQGQSGRQVKAGDPYVTSSVRVHDGDLRPAAARKMPSRPK
jgi:hypothetical protein